MDTNAPPPQITTARRMSDEAGTCNACGRFGGAATETRPYEVLEISLRSVGFRLCAHCLNALRHNLAGVILSPPPTETTP